MIQGIVTKSGNSYALRVPKSFVVDNQLKLGQKVAIEDPLERQEKSLRALVAAAKRLGPVKGISDPVAWQRAQRLSDDPWGKIKQ